MNSTHAGFQRMNNNTPNLTNCQVLNNLDNLNVCFWNVYGLFSKLDFAYTFFAFLNTLDIFCLAETWIKEDFDIFCFSSRLTNFSLNWTFATQTASRGRAKGGLLIGIKKHLNTVWKFEAFNNITFLRNNISGFIILPIYIPPFDWDNTFAKYNDFVINFDLHNFLLLGDFNARIGQLDNTNINFNGLDPRNSVDKVHNPNGHKFLNFCDDFDFIILNGRGFSDQKGDFTFFGSPGQSVIDYALISRHIFDLILDFKVLLRIESDHFPILVTLNFNNPLPQDAVLLPLIPRLNWNMQNRDDFNEAVLNKLNLVQVSELSVNEVVDTIIEIISVSAVKPKNNKILYNKNWFDAECMGARKLYFKALKLFKSQGSNNNHDNVCLLKKNYFKLCRRKKHAYRDIVVGNFDNISEASDFWKAVKHLKKHDNCYSEAISADEWFNYFNNLLNPSIDFHIFSTAENLILNNDLDRDFAFSELKMATNNLKNNKAPGIDAIPSEFFKNLNDPILWIFLAVLNRIFNNQGFPINFTESIVYPLFKKGDLAIVSNFRGICFLSTFYKLYTQLLFNRIKIFVFNNNILHENQAGFRKGYSTSDHIFTLSAIIEDKLSAPKGKVFAFFIDFSSAFDTVNRDSLFYKLNTMGMSTKIILAIKAIYAFTKAKVWTKAGYTDTFTTKSGVRQGCLLSPLLFTLFLNDLNDYINFGGFRYNGVWIRMLLYADDIVFFAPDPDILQNMINKLYKYCDLWDLKVNLNKSKIMVFRKKGKLKKSYKWKYGNNYIEVVTSYKYLGVNFTSTGQFGNHLNLQLAVAKMGLNTVYRSFFNLQSHNIDSYFKLFDSVSRSVLCYAAQVWGFEKYEVVEKLQRFFIKKLFRLPYNTPNYMLLLETGRDPLFLYTLKLHWSFILHTFKLPSNRFSKILLQVGINRGHRWHKNIMNRAITFGNWNNFADFDNSNIVKTQLEILYLDACNKEHTYLFDQVMLGQFHPLYKEVKTSWGREPFFNVDLSLKEMRNILMARMEMLPLNWKPWYPSNNFKCSLCNLNVIEDINHFLFVCPILKEFQNIDFNNSDNVILILNGSIGWKNLANYVNRALNYRTMLTNEFNFND